jgi:hypothetical protein
MNVPLKKNLASPHFTSGLSLLPRPAFDRETQLPRLLGLWPSEVRDYSAAGTARLIALLRKAIRAERRRGQAGDWAYDLNRHLALAEALNAERARLKSLQTGIGGTGGQTAARASRDKPDRLTLALTKKQA